MIAQHLALIVVPEDATTLQFWDHEIDKIVQSAGQKRRLDDKSVRGLCLKPVLHLVGDSLRRSDQLV